MKRHPTEHHCFYGKNMPHGSGTRWVYPLISLTFLTTWWLQAQLTHKCLPPSVLGFFPSQSWMSPTKAWPENLASAKSAVLKCTYTEFTEVVPLAAGIRGSVTLTVCRRCCSPLTHHWSCLQCNGKYTTHFARLIYFFIVCFILFLRLANKQINQTAKNLKQSKNTNPEQPQYSGSRILQYCIVQRQLH